MWPVNQDSFPIHPFLHFRKKELDKRDVGGVESSVGEFLESSFANDRRGSLGPPLPFLAS